jgi:hypothetical protein
MWGVILIGLTLDIASESRLPPELRSFLESESQAAITPISGIALLLGAFSLVLAVLASINLCRLQRNGIRQFLFAVILGVIAVPLLGPSVFSPVGALFSEVESLLTGVILGFLFTSDARGLFGIPNPAADDARPAPIG